VAGKVENNLKGQPVAKVNVVIIKLIVAREGFSSALQHFYSTVQRFSSGLQKFCMDNADLVTNGVIGDPTEGPDSALYEAFGYVRKSEKKSGLTRKEKTTRNGSGGTGT
jgi:hypothetical protein